jgi:hypothetical protein
MSAKYNKTLKILSFLGVALLSLPASASELSADRFLDLNQYEMTLQKIDQVSDTTLVEEISEYMDDHEVAPHTALSRLSGEKFMAWSEKLVFGSTSKQAGPAAEGENESVVTRLKLQLDPLKEKARLKIQGLLYGQIEVGPNQHLVSLDLFESSNSQMKLQYQHQSTTLDKKDQLQFRWHF